ncbi:MAG TPA: hypothetical protein VJT09_03890 [Pyrinomonadaceae bacterium]|nr:hypothetical protein [Pyrinomonadaceae bacterium]
MKLILSLLLVTLVSPSLAPARFADSRDEKLIQGTWRLDGNNDGHAWYLQWKFDHGKFTMIGYPPLRQEGSYRITKTGPGTLVLALYDQRGNFGTEDSEIGIAVDRRKDQLKIKGQGPFARVIETSNN